MKLFVWKRAATLLGICLLAGAVQAQTVSRDILAAALRDGGFVIVMRHASSPHELPDEKTANPDNVDRERQLDAAGRRDATAMGAALRRLGIPIGEVMSSPTYRTLETAHLMGFTDVETVPELGNEGMRASSEASAEWLRKNVATKVAKGNRLLITHGPNLAAAFPQYTEGMVEGEALIFDPRGMKGPVMINRIKIDEWPDL